MAAVLALSMAVTAAGSAVEAARSRGPARTWIRAVAAVAVCLALGSIALKEIQYARAGRVFDEIRASVPTSAAEDVFLSPTPGVLATQDPQASPAPYATFLATDTKITSDGVLPFYVALYRKNPDLAGWLRFPGWTVHPIDYPVMYSGNDSTYLELSFARRKSASGCLFFDGRNDPTTLARNFVVYGHAMRSNAMFGNLEDYPSNPVEIAGDHTIYVDLLWTRLEYEVFSTYTIDKDGDYRRTDFADEADFGAYVALLASRSVHDFGVSVGPSDRILTLSTCDNDTNGRGRVAIHAKMVRQIVYERLDVSSQDYEIPADVSSAVVPTGNPPATKPATPPTPTSAAAP